MDGINPITVVSWFKSFIVFFEWLLTNQGMIEQTEITKETGLMNIVSGMLSNFIILSGSNNNY